MHLVAWDRTTEGSVRSRPRDVTQAGWLQGYEDSVAGNVRQASPSGPSLSSAHMWLGRSVRLVWVVRPEARAVDVYRPGHATQTVRGEAEVDGLDVLPGFSCPLDAVFGPERNPPAAD